MVIPELPEPLKKHRYFTVNNWCPQFFTNRLSLGARLGCPPMVPGRLSPSSFICNEAECESPEVIYGASRGERSGERACLGYG